MNEKLISGFKRRLLLIEDAIPRQLLFLMDCFFRHFTITRVLIIHTRGVMCAQQESHYADKVRRKINIKDVSKLEGSTLHKKESKYRVKTA